MYALLPIISLASLMPQARVYPDFEETFKRFAAASEKTSTASPELGTKQPPQITERNENDAGMPASPQDTLGVRNIHFSAISNFHHFIGFHRVGLRTLRYRQRSQPGVHHYSKSTSYFSSRLSLTKKKGMDLALPISAPVLACPQRVQVLSRKYCTQHRIFSKICDMTVFQVTYYSIASLRSRERQRARSGCALPHGTT